MAKAQTPLPTSSGQSSLSEKTSDYGALGGITVEGDCAEAVPSFGAKVGASVMVGVVVFVAVSDGSGLGVVLGAKGGAFVLAGSTSPAGGCVFVGANVGVNVAAARRVAVALGQVVCVGAKVAA